MPYHLEFDRDKKVLCTTIEGRFSFADFWCVGEETRRHIVEKNPVAGIWNFSKVTDVDISRAELLQAVEASPFYPPGIPRVIVAPSDLVFGMSRWFQILSEKTRPELQVVRTREEAYRILGIQEIKLERV